MKRQMNPDKQRAGQERTDTPQASQQPGGREFGNVIEPMQAQTASGNKGLAGESEKNSPTRNEADRNKKPAA